MNRNLKYTSFLFSILSLCSCSNNEEVFEETPKAKEEMTFSFVVDSESVNTRAYTSDQFHVGATDMTYTKSVVIGISNKNEAEATGETTKYLKLRKRYPSDGGNANLVFWDDVSSDTYDVRKEGVTVNIWAARLTSGVTASVESPEISDAGVLTWNIITNQAQSADEYKKNDLLAADYQSAYKASTAAIPLCFHHAMTKISVNVKGGTGYTSDEVKNAPAVTLKSMNIKATVDLTKKHGLDNTETESGFVNPSAAPADVTMSKLTEIETATNYDVSFAAIVAPGNVITVGNEIGTIVVSNANNQSNTYKLIASKKLIAGWTGKTESEIENDASVTLAYGVNYVINATVNKQEITYTAKIVGWEEKTGEGTAEITFSTTGTQNMTPEGNAFEKPFTVWSKKEPESDYNKGSLFTNNGTNYTTTIPMYWFDASDNRYFRAALYDDAGAETLVTAENPTGSHDATVDNQVIVAEAVSYSPATDLLWGTSGSEIVKPTTTDVKMQFSHALSKVTLSLITSTNSDGKMDLSNIKKVEITNLTTKGSIALADGSCTLSTEETYKNQTVTLTPSTSTTDSWTALHLMLPQTITADSKVIITFNGDANGDGTYADGAVYSIKLEDCVSITRDADGKPVGDPVAIPAWEQGKHYQYTIKVEKELITFWGKIKDWVDAPVVGGEAVLDWE